MALFGKKSHKGAVNFDNVGKQVMPTEKAISMKSCIGIRRVEAIIKTLPESSPARSVRAPELSELKT